MSPNFTESSVSSMRQTEQGSHWSMSWESKFYRVECVGYEVDLSASILEHDLGVQYLPNRVCRLLGRQSSVHIEACHGSPNFTESSVSFLRQTEQRPHWNMSWDHITYRVESVVCTADGASFTFDHGLGVRHLPSQVCRLCKRLASTLDHALGVQHLPSRVCRLHGRRCSVHIRSCPGSPALTKSRVSSMKQTEQR